MQKLTFGTSVLLVLSEVFQTRLPRFSAHDVTVALRGKVNSNEIEFTDSQREDVDGVNTYRVEHNRVREQVNELYEAGLMPQYSRGYAKGPFGSYRVFELNGVPAPTTSTGSVVPTAQPVPAQLPVATVLLTAPNADTAEKVKVYIKNQLAAGKQPNLKQVQSRLKGVAITCEQLSAVVKSLGFLQQPNPSSPQSPSLYIVVG